MNSQLTFWIFGRKPRIEQLAGPRQILLEDGYRHEPRDCRQREKLSAQLLRQHEPRFEPLSGFWQSEQFDQDLTGGKLKAGKQLAMLNRFHVCLCTIEPFQCTRVIAGLTQTDGP